MKVMRFDESVIIDIGEKKSLQKTQILKAVQERKSSKDKSPVAIYPKIEAIHVGTTKNNNHYTANTLKGDISLKSGVYSWLMPYRKPMLTHHNKYSGEPIGRIKNATFVSETQANKQGIMIIPEITDPEAIEKVLDGRYFTVSVGGETESAVCSICATNRVEEWCEHDKGQKYDGKDCYWIIGDTWFNELSFVNVPADDSAMIVDIEVAGVDEFVSDEHFYSFGESVELYKPPRGFVTYEKKLLKDGLEIESLYGLINTFKSAGVSETEIIQRWDEIIESVRKNPMKKEVARVNFEELLAHVRAMEESALAEFLSKDTADVTEMQVQLVVTKEACTKLADQVSTLTSEKETLEGQVVDITKQRDELQTKTTEAQETIVTLQKNLHDTSEEQKRLETENADLFASAHKSLAERVVDLKIALHKPGVEKREEALADHIERKAESLQDALADLTRELETGTGVVSPGQATNESLANGDQKHSTIVDAEPAKPAGPSGPKTDEQVLLRLFGSRKQF